MKTSLACLATLLVALLVLTPRAYAEESKALDKVNALAVKVRDADASWESRYHAYLVAKEAMGEAKGAEQNVAKAAYEAIRPEVAEALRRTTLPLGGWLMGFLAATLLWGGLTITLTIAMRAEKARKTYGPDAT